MMDTTDTSVRDVVGFLKNSGYRQIEYLGKGGFGSVLSATLLNEEAVAIKIVKKEMYWDLEERIWPRLHHKNILPLLEMIEVEDLNLKLFVMPKQPYVLHKVLSSDSFLSDENGLLRVKHWLVDILHGLNYLHSCGYAHLDLKKDNVLISADDTAVICDFSGLNVVNVPIRRLCSPKKLRPPEWYNECTYETIEGCTCDLWLFGLMTLNIMTSNWPSKTMGHVIKPMDWKTSVEPVLIEALKDGKFCPLMRKSFPSVAIPDEELLLAHGFVSSIMHWDKWKRPSVPQILSHPFLADLKSGDNLCEFNTKADEVNSVLTSPVTEELIKTKSTHESSSMNVPKTKSIEKLTILYNDHQQHFEYKDPLHEKGDDVLPEIKKTDEKAAILNDHRHHHFDNRGFILKEVDISPEKSDNVLNYNQQEFDADEKCAMEIEKSKDKKKRAKRIKEWIVKKYNQIFKKKKKYVHLLEESE